MKSLVVVVLAMLGIGSPAGAAHAEHNPANERDARRCVTLREPWSTPAGTRRPEVERRWDVRGKGKPYRDRITGNQEWIYPLCDRRFPESYAAAVFNARGGLVAVATYVSGDDVSPAPTTSTADDGGAQVVPLRR